MLCKVIDNVDLIVTTKLHVGVVGARLGKSVISFSVHTEKIRRLYEEIGELERTYPLEKLDFDTGIKMLEKFHDKPINISDEVINKAKKSLGFIDEFLKII
jgi:polysaccharide pyruvyl transferase WcaK-like protein